MSNFCFAVPAAFSSRFRVLFAHTCSYLVLAEAKYLAFPGLVEISDESDATLANKSDGLYCRLHIIKKLRLLYTVTPPASL